MNTTLTIIIISFFALVGIGIALYAFSRPIVIKFSYSPIDWLAPIMLSGILFMGAFLSEFFFSEFFANTINPSNVWLLFLKSILSNGLLVPLICLLLSFAFMHMCERLNFDYLPAYNKKIPGICLSVIALITCSIFFINFFVMDKESVVQDQAHTYLMSRIVLWIGASLSTFVGFGCGYSSRLEKEIKIDGKIASSPKKDPEKMRVYLPIALYLLLYALLMFLIIHKGIIARYNVAFLGSAFSCSFFSLSTTYILKSIFMPGIKSSKRRFIRAVNAYEKNKVIKTHYGRNEYYIENNIVHISKIRVEYPKVKNKTEFEELFYKKEFPYPGRTELSEYLESRTKAQKKFIDKGFEECVEEKKQEKKKDSNL